MAVAALGAAAVLVGGPTRDGVTVLGASLGAAVAWTWVDRRDARHDVPRALALAALVVLGGVKAASHLLEPALVVVLAVNAAVLAAVVGLPGVRRA
jgi:alpha-beta hydrolase superfamily lysophospholipase